MSIFEELDNEIEAYLLRADDSDPAMFYFTGFEAHDPVIYLRNRDEDILLVSPLEITRARREADVDRVVSTSEFRDSDSTENVNPYIQMLKAFLQDEGVANLAVPKDFPLKLGDDLRSEGFSLTTVEDPSKKTRQIKTSEELEKLRKAQETTEAGIKHARDVLEEASIEKDRIYYNGEELTSEKLRASIKNFLIERGCEVPKKTVVASGSQTSRPHDIGSGALKPREPIIIDIFPRKDRYFGDMTRTFFKGEPSEEVKEMYLAVLEAQEAAFQVFDTGEGIELSEVHGKVCDILEKEGFDTLRSDPDTEEGFITATGHSIGLEPHELPKIANDRTETETGMVFAVEPGLYYEDIGGVRIEDMIVVEEDGFKNLNSMKKGLEENIV